MKLPQDLANLLAVAIRDVIWFKHNVRSFLNNCGVPKSIMIEVDKMIKNKAHTIKIIHFVLERLAEKGDEGSQALRKMLTDIYYWKDIHSLPNDRKDSALKSLEEFQKAYQKYKAQLDYQKKQEEQMHEERVKRVSMKNLDHNKLQSFRDEFDEIFKIQNPQERGNRFESLMNKIFDYYCEESKGPFKRMGEQIDGLFCFDKHWWYVEVRWREQKANAGDISQLRDRAKNAFGGDTKALFISFNGFTSECLESLKGYTDERVILMDGVDLRYVLDCQIAFDVLLAEKQADIIQNKRPFIGVLDILKSRGNN